MCEYSGRLIAWLDGELEQADAESVERHVLECDECRDAVAIYREITDAFLPCYVSAIPASRRPRSWQWIAVAGAAAILLLSVVAWPRQEQLPALQHAVPAPGIAFEKAPARIVAVHARHLPASQPRRAQWIPPQPTVEVSFPADALFPPGAIPPGFSLIADIRPQP